MSGAIQSLACRVLAAAIAAGAGCAVADAQGPSTRVVVDRALEFLQKDAGQWKAARRCAACHHAAMTLWAMNEARAAGYQVSEPALKNLTDWAFGDMKTNSLSQEPPPRNVLNLGWVYVLLSVETAPAFKARAAGTLAAADAGDQIGAAANEAAVFSARQILLKQIVNKQDADGSWGRPLDLRVPLGGPMEDIALLARLALLESGDTSATVTDCIHKSSAWLAAHPEKTSRQTRNLQLLTAAYQGRSAAELRSASASIQTEQNTDGGWSQTADMASDAYATGQTLYVLVRAGVPPESAALKKGTQFLRETQRPDGSWPMTSRVHAKNLDPITSTGTAWAVLGLLRASP